MATQTNASVLGMLIDRIRGLACGCGDGDSRSDSKAKTEKGDLMPSNRTTVLNRAATASFAIGDTLSAINATYTRRVEISQGLSLTGFIASVDYTAINFHVDNFMEVYLFEDPPFDTNQDIPTLNFEPSLLFKCAKTVDRLTQMISERFDVPYKLRYGHVYVLLARLVSFVAAVPAINIHLTALGFENPVSESGILR